MLATSVSLPNAAAQSRFDEQAMHVDAVDTGRTRRGADVATMRGEQLFEIATFDVLRPAFSHLAQRQRHVDRRFRRTRGSERDLLARETRLEVVAQLADVARPAMPHELGQ